MDDNVHPEGLKVEPRQTVPRSVFVSFAHEDSSFVTLLLALLNHHRVQHWCSPARLEPGTTFSEEIPAALDEADLLAVIVSKQAAKSKWVAKEIASFQARRSRPLIPLCLDSTSPEDVAPGLSAYQAIALTENMEAGLRALFASFGIRFLTGIERRTRSGRRTGDDRRSAGDRRGAQLSQRLRRGMWKAYHSATGIGEFEIVERIQELSKMQAALMPELQRYQFVDQAEGLALAVDFLEQIAYEEFTSLRNVGPVRAVYLIEAIAEAVQRRYHVRVLTRRETRRRNNPQNRRD